MSFGANKKSNNKSELGNSKGWPIDFSTNLSHSSNRLQTETRETDSSTMVSKPSDPPVLTSAVETPIWGTPTPQIQRPSPMLPPILPQDPSMGSAQTTTTTPTTTSWGIPISRPMITGQSTQPFETFLTTARSQAPPPIDSIPFSCATSVTSWQSSYDERSSVMLPPPPPPPPPPQSITHLPTRPLLPYKTVEVPKSALHSLYGKEPRRRSLAASDFVTWHNGGPPHELQWTSCFVCPLTGELFLTRPYGANTDFHQQDGLIWYRKKTSAEHGAAACAYDCLTYRDFRSINPHVPPFKLLLADGEFAYDVDVALSSLPNHIPSHVQTKVEQLRTTILTNPRNTRINTTHSSPETEVAWKSRPEDTTRPDYFYNI